MVFTGFFDKLAPFPAGLRPLARELGMAGKILLGSDFPNLPYPYARQLAGLVALDLGEGWLRAVCWENPAARTGTPASGCHRRARRRAAPRPARAPGGRRSWPSRTRPRPSRRRP